MNYGAFGLVEVVGSSNAILVIDQMLKTSDVSFLTWQTKCGGHATVFLTGDVSAVTAALYVGNIYIIITNVRREPPWRSGKGFVVHWLLRCCGFC